MKLFMKNNIRYLHNIKSNINKMWYFRLNIKATNHSDGLYGFSGIQRDISRFGLTSAEINQSLIGFSNKNIDIRNLNLYSKSYINHLINSNEILASMILTLNNIIFYQQLMKEIRQAIKTNSFDAFYNAFSGSIIRSTPS